MNASAAPRILLIRLSAIGDVAMASGLIPAVRQAWPDAHLAWLVEPAAADLLRHNPRLDRVIVWPKNRWRQQWRQRRYGMLWRQFRQLRAELVGQRFDLVIDAQGLLKSGLWAWLSRAPERIGIGPREGNRWLLSRTVEPRPDDPRLGSEYRQLAQTLGLNADAYAMDVAVGAADRRSGQALLARHGVGSAPAYAVLCPFTTRPQKHWFESRWAELATALPQRLGLTPVLLGGPADRDAAGRIVAATAATAGLVDLTGRTTLGQAAALIRQARLLLGVDTGLSHLGIAFGVPTLALFGSTRPYLDTGSANARVLYHPLACSPCRRNPTCHDRFDCMRAHTVADVLGAAQALLQQRAA